MFRLLYKIDVEKNFEYGVKTIIDLIWGISCTSPGNGHLFVNLYIADLEERNSIKDTISHLPHVLEVKVH